MMILLKDNLNNQVILIIESTSRSHLIISAPPPKPAPLSDEHLNEIDDPIHRENVRQMDEYKDDNPRGSGNRYNRS